MTEKCGNEIKFLVGFSKGQPTYETFECVKDKSHIDDHETYGETGATHHHWVLTWWDTRKSCVQTESEAKKP